MYWTDWGEPAKIERASMDGTNRHILHSEGVVYPDGITIDYVAQRIYWTDQGVSGGVIEYSNTDGTGRNILSSNVGFPTSITLWESLVFWTEWNNAAIQYTHKLHGENITGIIPYVFISAPAGIEVISENRQNLCEWLVMVVSINEAFQ